MEKDLLTQSKLKAVGADAFFQPRDLEPLGISFRLLQPLVSPGTAEKVGYGLYRLTATDSDEFETMAMTASTVPRVTICLLSALRIQGMARRRPTRFGWRLTGRPVSWHTFLPAYVSYAFLPLGSPSDGPSLAWAIVGTFKRRHTTIEAPLPAALTLRFFTDGALAEQWRVYLLHNGLPGALGDFGLLGDQVQSSLGPVWGALAHGEVYVLQWPIGGPWGVGK